MIKVKIKLELIETVIVIVISILVEIYHRIATIGKTYAARTACVQMKRVGRKNVICSDFQSTSYLHMIN